MSDDQLFFALEAAYGTFALDARFRGVETAYATKGLTEDTALDTPWVDSTVADLRDAPSTVVSAYVAKASKAGVRCVLLVKVQANADWWHSYAVKKCYRINFIRGQRPLATLEFGPTMRGSPLIDSWDISKWELPSMNRVELLRRRAATDRLITGRG